MTLLVPAESVLYTCGHNIIYDMTLPTEVAIHLSQQLHMGKFDNIRGQPSIIGSKYILVHF